MHADEQLESRCCWVTGLLTWGITALTTYTTVYSLHSIAITFLLTNGIRSNHTNSQWDWLLIGFRLQFFLMRDIELVMLLYCTVRHLRIIDIRSTGQVTKCTRAAGWRDTHRTTTNQYQVPTCGIRKLSRWLVCCMEKVQAKILLEWVLKSSGPAALFNFSDLLPMNFPPTSMK